MKKMLLTLYYKFLKITGIITVLYNKMISLIMKPPIVRTTDETLDKMILDECSISRFGDGEFALMYGESLLFQPYDPLLSLRLREIIRSHREKHMVCIPNVFESVDWCTERSKKYWIKYLNLHRRKIYKMIDMKKEYYDTQVTRLYIDQKDKSKAGGHFSEFKKIWFNKEIVIVEGEQSRLGVGNNLFNDTKSIKRIICPAKNAFAKYNDILNEIKKQDQSKLVLIALGPTATVLAYDLSAIGYQALDIGHIDIEYEWFLQKVTEKCPVKNKYIGEIPGGTNVGNIYDVEYERGIISKII